MSAVEMVLFFAVFGIVMRVVGEKLKKNRNSSEKYQKILTDFSSSVSRMLMPGERVEGMCGYSPCAAVTNRRLIIGDKKGIREVPFSSIRKTKGMNYSGNRTSDPDNMLVYEIYADKKYVLGNHSEGFAQVVRVLNAYTGGR